ncbi:MAG TPA: hypothetical protein DCY94_04025 [Firmicutes bacterium]|nr:hypothetical protein [Bacillota bacterium]
MDSLCEELHMRLPYSTTYSEARALLASKKERLERHIEKLETLLKAITENGLNTVTYELPILNLASTSRTLGYAYLMITGIKKNAEEKRLINVEEDKLEAALFAKESEMAKYIDDNFRIDEDSFKDFMALFRKYIEIYRALNEFETIVKDEEYLIRILFEMALYSLYMNEAYELSGEEYDEEFSRVNRMIADEGLSLENVLDKWYRDFKKRKAEELKHSIEKWVGKKEMNIIRGYLRTADELNREGLGYLEDAVSKLEEIHPLARQLPALEDFVLSVNMCLDTHFELGVTYQDMLDNIRGDYLLYKDNIRRFQSIMNGLSKDGMKCVTYSLPIVNVTVTSTSLAYSYLMVTGIKKNALEKRPEDELCDELEKKLLDYERIMASYIDEDYCVDLDHITEFIATFKSYLTECFYGRDFSRDCGDEEQIKSAIFQMGLYALYSNTGIILIREIYSAFFEKYKSMLSEGFTEGGALKIMFKEAKKLDKKVRLSLMSDEEADELEETKEEKKKNPLSDYIEGNVVVRTCNLEVFKRLLDSTDLDQNRKNEFYAQMRNLINKENQAKYEASKKKVFAEVLDETEIALYDSCKKLAVNADFVTVIEDIVGMIIACESDEEKEMLISMLHENIGELKEEVPKVENPKAANVPAVPVVYYTEKTIVDGDEVAIPRVYKSIIQAGKRNYKEINGQFKKLLTGLTIGDREVKGKNLSCKVWAKGWNKGGYRLFYTMISGVFVIIDVMNAEDGFRDVARLVGTKEFKSFAKSISDCVAKGEVPTATKYTEMVTQELDRVNEQDKRKKFTQ